MPSFYDIEAQNKYIIGLSNEFINTNTKNRAQSVYFHGISQAGMHYGVAYSTHAQTNNEDLSPPSEFSFHLNQKIIPQSVFFTI